MGKKIRQSRYSTQRKIEALALLKKNKGNILATVKMTGISATTLKLWSKTFRNNIADAESTSVIVREIVENVALRDREMLDRYYDIKKLIVDRIKDLIMDERNLDNLQKTLKTLCEIDGTSKAKANPGEEKPIEMNIYQQINQHLNTIGYEPKNPITAIGHTEE